MVTTVILIITVFVSIAAFNNLNLMHQFTFHPYIMEGNPKNYYRFFSHGLIHADYMHLAFNMLALYSFGSQIESIMGSASFLLMYISALFISSFPAFLKHKHNNAYRAVGASGAVSAVIFAGVVISPYSKISIYFLPGIWAILFAGLYLGYCIYMTKRGTDHIAHDAHLIGSLYGWVFMLVLHPSLFKRFIELLIAGPNY
jgi:membrane associated rhomboid family serine protease